MKPQTKAAAGSAAKWALGLSFGYTLGPIVFALLSGVEPSDNFLAKRVVTGVALLPVLFIGLWIWKTFRKKDLVADVSNQTDQMAKSSSTLARAESGLHSTGATSQHFNDGSSSDLKQWMYADAERSLGPVAIAELKSLLSIRTISAKTLVWRQGMDAWRSIDSTPELTCILAPPLPIVTRIPSPSPLPQSQSVQSVPAPDGNDGKQGHFVIGVVMILLIVALAFWLAMSKTSSDTAAMNTNSSSISKPSESSIERRYVSEELVDPRTEVVTNVEVVLDQWGNTGREESGAWTNPVTKRSFDLPSGWTSKCMGNPVRGQFCILKNARGKKYELSVDTGPDALLAPDLVAYVKDWRHQAMGYKLKQTSVTKSIWQGEGRRQMRLRSDTVSVVIIRNETSFVRVTEVNLADVMPQDDEEGQQLGRNISLSFR